MSGLSCPYMSFSSVEEEVADLHKFLEKASIPLYLLYILVISGTLWSHWGVFIWVVNYIDSIHQHYIGNQKSELNDELSNSTRFARENFWRVLTSILRFFTVIFFNN